VSELPTATPTPPAGAPGAAKSGDLAVAFGTLVYLLFDAGHAPADPALVEACEAVRSAAPEAADAAGQALVALLAHRLPADGAPAGVAALAAALYGADKLVAFEGADRAEKARAARAWQFRTSLPFLARVVDRFPTGDVGLHWVLVERVTDVVTCMDPYPWDGIDEETTQPLVDFLVKWELAGCACVAVTA
jgi:membrane-associated protease RseP (regulator of RpoE activity)